MYLSQPGKMKCNPPPASFRRANERELMSASQECQGQSLNVLAHLVREPHHSTRGQSDFLIREKRSFIKLHLDATAGLSLIGPFPTSRLHICTWVASWGSGSGPSYNMCPSTLQSVHHNAARIIRGGTCRMTSLVALMRLSEMASPDLGFLHWGKEEWWGLGGSLISLVRREGGFIADVGSAPCKMGGRLKGRVSTDF